MTLGIELLNPITNCSNESEQENSPKQDSQNKRMTRPSRLVNDKKYYSSFRTSKDSFALGDVVILESICKNETRIGKLVRIYEIPRSHIYYADIKWFCTADIVNALEIGGKRKLKLQVEDDEVLYDLGPPDTIKLTEIVCKTQVLSEQEYKHKFAKSSSTVKRKTRNKKPCFDDIYFYCSRGIDTKLGIVRDDLNWEDIESGKDFSLTRKNSRKSNTKNASKTSKTSTRSVSKEKKVKVSTKAVKEKPKKKPKDEPKENIQEDFQVQESCSSTCSSLENSLSESPSDSDDTEIDSDIDSDFNSRQGIKKFKKRHVPNAKAAMLNL